MENLMNTLKFRDITFVRGDGSYLIDAHEKRYLDFFTDVGTASLGYSTPEQMAVMTKMLRRGTPIHAPNLYGFSLRNDVAKRLCFVTGMDKVFFCNSGTESVEAAIKLSRKYQHDKGRLHKSWIASYVGGFHGRTYGALRCGHGPSYHYEGFAPFPEHFAKFAMPSDINWDITAAVVLAPVFGNNDVIVYTDEFLKLLREKCTETDTLLVFDEVQTGSGRCGAVTYANKIGVQPDVITLAKGLGMGCPVGATLAKGDAAQTFTPGSHFSTFGGNPISMAFVEGMLDWLEIDGQMDTINEIGDMTRGILRGLVWTKNIRGVGLLNAFDIDKDGVAFSLKCLEKGLLIGAFRSGPGPVKITPPLNVEPRELMEAASIMDEAYGEI